MTFSPSNIGKVAKLSNPHTLRSARNAGFSTFTAARALTVSSASQEGVSSRQFIRYLYDIAKNLPGIKQLYQSYLNRRTQSGQKAAAEVAVDAAEAVV